MAATVALVEKNGPSGSAVLTTKTNSTVRFKNADSADIDLVNPLVRPAAGSYDYSYEKWLRLNVTGGTYTAITNIVAYSDGANGMGTGVELYAKVVATYATPSEPTSTTGFTSFFNYTSSSPLSLGAGPYTGTAQIGSHLVAMMRVASTVSSGITPSETLTITWDET